jgi:hypothetical protein
MNEIGNKPQNGNGIRVNERGSDPMEGRGKWKGENVDILLTMQIGVFNHARDRVIASGASDLSEIDLEAILEHATAMAEETYRRAFNPAQNIDDQLKQLEFQRNQKELADAILGVKHTKAELNKRKDFKARVESVVPNKPDFPIFSACFGLAVIALTVAPTLHDTVFSSFGEDWAWASGGITGLAWGAFVAYSILDGGRDSEEQTMLNWLGLLAAVGMAIALGLIRLMNATDITDYIVAAAFTLLEIFISIGLEAIARKYHKEHHHYSLKAMAATEATNLVNNAEAELYERQADVEMLSENNRLYIDYVSERELRSVSRSELIASAHKAARDGANDGLEYNRGKLLGINR